MTGFCPRCGAELDDYGPCGCAIAFDKKPKKKAWSMRTMVEKKLARQREKDAKLGHGRT